jgi:NADPH-dependent 2,4-dienoyl-CoA reductase/sulfur reductase-like enzyme
MWTRAAQTAFHMVRDEEFFRKTKGVDVRARTEAVAIDRAAKTVTLRHLPSKAEEVLPYDKLVLGTGSSPIVLPIPGANLPGVFTVNNLGAAQSTANWPPPARWAAQWWWARASSAWKWPCPFPTSGASRPRSSSSATNCCPGQRPNIARMAMHHMREKGVEFRLAEQVQGFEAGADGRVAHVVTNAGAVDADLVIHGRGRAPQRRARPRLRPGRARTRRHHRGQDHAHLRSGHLAGGDCVVLEHAVSKGAAYLPMGSMANRQGRVIGTNLAGGHATFPPVVGSWCVKLFDLAAAGAGLTLAAAQNAGFDALCVHAGWWTARTSTPKKGL